MQTSNKLHQTVANLYLRLTNDYSTENLNYNTLALAQLTTYCYLHLQTGSKCTNHWSPSSLPITLIFRLSITIQTGASLHLFEFSTVRMLKRLSPPTVLLRTPFIQTINSYRTIVCNSWVQSIFK